MNGHMDVVRQNVEKEQVLDFIAESNRIEDIHRMPTQAEVKEFHRFMGLKKVKVKDLEHFVSIYQPDAELRDKPGLNIRVGTHIPIYGGPMVLLSLRGLLDEVNAGADPYDIHLRYENLHPFTDGNGRSGRMLWAWQVRDLRLGFLHAFYYQVFQAQGRGV